MTLAGPCKTCRGVGGDCADCNNSGFKNAERRSAARIAELDAQIAEIHSSARRMTFRSEWYIDGVRNPPGEFVIMRVGPVKDGDEPAF